MITRIVLDAVTAILIGGGLFYGGKYAIKWLNKQEKDLDAK